MVFCFLGNEGGWGNQKTIEKAKITQKTIFQEVFGIWPFGPKTF